MITANFKPERIVRRSSFFHYRLERAQESIIESFTKLGLSGLSLFDYLVCCVIGDADLTHVVQAYSPLFLETHADIISRPI